MKLADANRLLLEAQKAEAHAKAEASVAKEAMASNQQQHRAELLELRHQHSKVLSDAADKAASEVSSLQASILQINKDKSALQEQVAFLKAQLQFALKVG